MLGDRLRLARKKSGLSLRALSEATGHRVSAQAIGKYENGKMAPGSEVLLALSKALGEPLDFFTSPSDAELLKVDFRKRASTSAKERAQVEAVVLDHVERYLEVERALDLDAASRNRPVPARRIASLDEAEALANEVREAWDLGTDPLLDVTETLEEQGLKVFVIELPAKVDGLTCLVRSSTERDPVLAIAVNRDRALERRRLTLAHELAHLVIEDGPDVEVEKAAMRFAGAFLVPAAHLWGRIGRRRRSYPQAELMELKRLYRVSAGALLVRLEQIGAIERSTLSYLFRTSARKWRTEEPAPIEDDGSERAHRFRRLCYRALGDDRLSASRVAELLRVPLATLRRSL